MKISSAKWCLDFNLLISLSSDECFMIRPDSSEDNRKIGARGNMCVLHVSPCGLILALEVKSAGWGSLYWHTWISNYIHYKVWDEITYPFPTSTVAPLKFGNG